MARGYARRKRSFWGGEAPPPAGSPTIDVPPVIGGSFFAGQNATLTDGVFTGSPTSYEYKWQLDGADIFGANTNVQPIIPANDGGVLRGFVRATNGFGTSLWAGSSNTFIAIDAFVWLDASDTSTILDTLGEVYQQNDKSGNNFHAFQATAGLQPLTNSASVNGLNALLYDGIDDGLRITDNAVDTIGNTATDSSMFLALVFTNTALTPTHIIGGARSTNGASLLGFGSNSTALNRVAFANTTTARSNYPQIVKTLNTTDTIVLAGETIIASSSQTTWDEAGVTNTNTSVLSFGLTEFSIGRRFSSGFAPTAMKFCEYVWLRRPTTTAEKNQIRNYLGAKWGATIVNI